MLRIDQRLVWAAVLPNLLATQPLAAIVVPIGSGAFGPGTTTITFSEVPIGTHMPFTIGIANFVGLSGATYSPAGVPPAWLPPAPSGGPFFETGTVNGEDVCEIVLSQPMAAVGSYFSTQGNEGLFGDMQLEVYTGTTLLGIVHADPNPGTHVGFVGADAGAAIIDRFIFRDINPNNPVSLALDDVKFAIPAPGGILLLASPLLIPTRRRRGNGLGRSFCVTSETD